MVDKADNMEGKCWWESQLDWTLPDSVQDTIEAGGRLLRNIPATLSAYKLGKTSPMDHLCPDPVEKITRKNLKKPASTAAAGSQPQKDTRPLPRILPPPPKPPSLQKREQESQWVRAGGGQSAGSAASSPAPWAATVKSSNVPSPSVEVETSIDAAAVSASAVAKAYLQTSATETHRNIAVKKDERKSPPTSPTSVPPKPTVISEVKQEELTNRVKETVEEKHLTLEQLLDPDFCGYTS
jgi:hypothetical protein